jgi:hypothetical protein
VGVGSEGSEDGCGSQKVEVPGRSWPEVGVMRGYCAEEGEHRRLDLVRDRIHHCIAVAGVVAAAGAAGSCRSAGELNPWRGIDGQMGDRTTATVEEVVAVVCCGSWLLKTVFEDGSATAWPLPGRVRRV